MCNYFTKYANNYLIFFLVMLSHIQFNPRIERNANQPLRVNDSHIPPPRTKIADSPRAPPNAARNISTKNNSKRFPNYYVTFANFIKNINKKAVCVWKKNVLMRFVLSSKTMCFKRGVQTIDFSVTYSVPYAEGSVINRLWCV